MGAWEGIAVVIDARARWHGRHAGGMRWLGRVASAHDDALVEPLMLEMNLLLVCYRRGVSSRCVGGVRSVCVLAMNGGV